jgi:hypothetical protein
VLNLAIRIVNPGLYRGNVGWLVHFTTLYQLQRRNRKEWRGATMGSSTLKNVETQLEQAGLAVKLVNFICDMLGFSLDCPIGCMNLFRCFSQLPNIWE